MEYKVLKNNQTFEANGFSIVPIRMEDRYSIMKWRNEQIYHLRQKEPLTKEAQDKYFETVVKSLFEKDQPDQILFSFLDNGKCVGYGGLVHINWTDQNAEISFVMDTALEKDFFGNFWTIYLNLIQQVAFEELGLHKIFTYSYNLRPKLYGVLRENDFKEEARLKEHVFFDGNFIDAFIHSVFRVDSVSFRVANEKDAKTLFDWTNDPSVRSNSLNTEPIAWEAHLNWFEEKLRSEDSQIYIFEVGKKPIGQVRLDFKYDHWLINYSIDSKFRGKGYGKVLIRKILDLNTFIPLKAIVKPDNIASLKVFTALGFNETNKESTPDDLVEFNFGSSLKI